MKKQKWAGVRCLKCKKELTMVGGLPQLEVREYTRGRRHYREDGCTGRVVEFSGETTI